jgi:hypothetical protein
MGLSLVSIWEPRTLVSRKCLELNPVERTPPLTSHSVQRGGKVEIIANDQGNRITPSWVAFTEEERLIGDAAKNQAPQNPENTVFDAKRLIGRTFDDKDVQRDTKHFPFKIVNKSGKPMIQVNSKGDLKDFVRIQRVWPLGVTLIHRLPRRFPPWS